MLNNLKVEDLEIVIFFHSNLNTNWLASFGVYGMDLVFGSPVT